MMRCGEGFSVKFGEDVSEHVIKYSILFAEQKFGGRAEERKIY